MSHPHIAEPITKVDNNPFEGLHISDDAILTDLEGRHPCPKCSKSRKYFCYTCYVAITALEGKLPQVKLPIKIDIIKHKHEIDGKSTSAHAAIIASDDVNVYTYPDIPDYNDQNVVLIFPSYTAVEISQLFNKGCDGINDIKREFDVELPKGYNKSTLMKHVPKYVQSNVTKSNNSNVLPIKKAVFIDSTWNQSKGIYKDKRIKKLPCVVLQNRISQFWRHQKGSPRWYLATIEAIHQFVLEVHLNAWGLHAEYRGLPKCFNENSLTHIEELTIIGAQHINAYNGQYDNLLFFFKHMYYLIHAYYDHDDLYAYKRRLM